MIGALDKISLFGMALGIGLMLQPWWVDGFRAGFFIAICCTILQIASSHLIKSS